MTKKESWIPLLVTLVVLGYFVYWAVGYVSRNKPQPAAVEPTTLARAVKVDPVMAEPAAVEPAPAATVAPEQRPAPRTPSNSSELANNSTGDFLENDDQIGGKHVQNRKILGVAREATIRH